MFISYDKLLSILNMEHRKFSTVTDMDVDVPQNILHIQGVERNEKDSLL